MRSWLLCALLFALSALFLAPALGGSGFWWTDETRHAMGGVFILDLLRDLPLDDPMGYALRYFAQYPALALNWYLPGFYLVEAGFFALFGVSETVAHWTVFAFVLLAARPLGEPVVQYGPFVMNTRDEIEQAIADYQSGRLV